MPGTPRQEGFIYLLHWQDRTGRVEHYVGWTTDLEARLKQHFSQCGGCPTTRGYRRQGMGGRLVRLWRGTMQGERFLQQSLLFPTDCPVCAGRAVRDVACEGWIDYEVISGSPDGPSCSTNALTSFGDSWIKLKKV